jgi:hypothetical protein
VIEGLTGASAFGSAVAALLFLRFWRRTHDSLFVFFAAAFLIEALARVGMIIAPAISEDNPYFYAVRVVEYGLILLAIWNKNRGR